MLSNTEKVVYKLINSDFQMLYEIYFLNSKLNNTLYCLSFNGYYGMIIDGSTKWMLKVRQLKSKVPQMSNQQKIYYNHLRQSIKFWDMSYEDYINNMTVAYKKSESYFENQTSTIARILKVFDIYGVAYFNKVPIGNTIHYSMVLPSFDYKTFKLDKQYTINVNEYAGMLIGNADINLNDSFVDCSNIEITAKDRGGIKKLGIEKDTRLFFLFNLACLINFNLYGLKPLKKPFLPSILRINYILYYYINTVLKDVNKDNQTDFFIDTQYIDDLFRNCMAHYGIGNLLKQNEVDLNDPFGGLTQKVFKIDYVVLNKKIEDNLEALLNQINGHIEKKLKLKK
ncbi:hypothetical protein ETI06_08310 [Macrococcoides goetzii]|nr:hypothetical protein [Macrococcus goetzii]TDM42343.1 hypothetical protein ETI10_04385 [Macrococcus goetzii]TDM47675.1 hypothetical protein ETI08_00655 [Macrococcus goetzii]TDM49023.1 hypothetical protein ETI06_08310 [Macrococcus goetzii]